MEDWEDARATRPRSERRQFRAGGVFSFPSLLLFAPDLAGGIQQSKDKAGTEGQTLTAPAPR